MRKRLTAHAFDRGVRARLFYKAPHFKIVRLCSTIFYFIFVKILETEQFGQCSDYQAIPGFGLQCKISRVENLLKDKKGLSENDVIPTSSDG